MTPRTVLRTAALARHSMRGADTAPSLKHHSAGVLNLFNSGDRRYRCATPLSSHKKSLSMTYLRYLGVPLLSASLLASACTPAPADHATR